MRAFTDSHAHLDMVAARLGQAAMDDLAASYALSPGAFVVDIGISPGDLAGRLARHGSLPFVKFTAGLWPGRNALADPRSSLALLERDISNPACVALGECGLDYFRMEARPEAQMALFDAQVDLAVAAGLPLVIHSRDAAEDTMRVLRKACGTIPVLIHCFGYGPEEAKAFLEMGCLISFAGNLGYGRAEPLRRALALVPPDRLLFETDAPYLNPPPRRGHPSSPLDIGRTIGFAAAELGADPGELSRMAHAATEAFFSGRERTAGRSRP